MYKRAAPLQIALALAGFLAGIVVWYQSSENLWLVGSLLLISVVPITLVAIKPVNDILLAPGNDPDSAETREFLERWGLKHWLRTGVSAVSFLMYLIAVVYA